MTRPHPLHGPHRLKLGVFSMNADGGLAITRAPERWRASWADNLEAAQIADRAGLDFLLPIARWRGFGGATRAREHSFETFTWAAALAAATRDIALFSTVHVPLVHPVYAAKALATVDHVSGGRAGLNIVCGWNAKEFAMFGASAEPRAYDRAREWLTIIERAYAEDEPFDFQGEYYRLKGVVSRPASLQRPRPVTMNAAFGSPGRDFAAQRCDFLFTTFARLEDARAHVEDVRARAGAREIGVYTVGHVVCRESDAEAEDYYERYAVELADEAAVDEHVSGKQSQSGSHDPETYRLHRKRFAGGAGTFPLVGSPGRIAETLAEIHAQGYAGAALSFVNYTQELPFFVARVLPLLQRMGLRA